MKQFFITVAGVITGFFLIVIIPLILIVFFGIMAALSGAGDKHLPGDAQVLRVDLRVPMTDQPHEGFFEESPSLITLVETLAKAEDDKRVKGMFIRANPWGMQPVHAEQVRLAIKSFQDKGKFVVVHAQGFEGTSITSYLSVAAADQLWIQDTASFTASGIATESQFLGGVFEKFKAKPEFEQFYEYKNSANTYTQKTFTDAHREATHSWASSIYTTAIAQIAEDRDQNTQTMSGLIEQGPYSSEDAVANGLADKLGHVVEAREAALELAGEDSELVELDAYVPAGNSRSKGKNKPPLVALIEGEGAITTGSGSDNPFSSESGIYSDQMAEAILEAADNKKVKALLIRVDSPGGSAIASDQIWHAIERAKENDKKIIISMGQLAASGGYYISAGADAILAYPTTLTGSIGVLGGKIVLDDSYDLVGYNVEQIKIGGEFAGAYSASKSFSDRQRDIFRSSMASVYEDFTSKVALGRDIPIERVLEIAKGRVWTGEQAKELGLVDELGGYRAAIAKTRQLLDVDEEDSIRVRRFPAPRSPFEKLSDMFGVSSDAAQSAARLKVLMESEEVKALIRAREISNNNGQVEMRANIPGLD